MGYVTHDYYKESYFGSSVESADFDKWESKAKIKLDYLTENRITEEMLLDEKLASKIKMAECEIIDILYKIDKASNMNGVNENGEGKIIKSRSSGSESISYDTGNDIYASAVGDVGATNYICLSSIKQYLFDTGLLYRGC